MLQELETAQQIINQKQELIDEYLTQITESQQQIATLERQCSHLQDNHEKQKQKATLLEQKLKEAELRLQRQQRHNIQFKAALDQCLETPGYVTPVNISTEEQQTPAIISSNSRIPKNEGIKPWSNYLEELENISEKIKNNHQEIEEKVEPKPENFINRIKVLNNTNFVGNELERKSPSPLLNRSNYQTKPKVKREIVLPQFRRLKLDDQI
jgi:exonuclease VII large subunit